MQGYEAVWPVAPLIPNDGINPAAVDDRNHDFLQQRVTAKVTLDHNHHDQYAHVHTTSSNVSESALPTLPNELDKEQEQSPSTGERSDQFQKTGRNLFRASSQSSLRAGKKRGALQGRYLCTICKIDYAQPQGLTRHEREKHKAKSCTYCSEFTWGRLYLYIEHLLKRHADIDPNAAISKATWTRRSSAIRRNHLPRQRISIPTDEHDDWSRAGSQAHPNSLTSSPSTVANPTPIPPPTIPTITYYSQPESTELATKEMLKNEDAFTLELHDINDDNATSPSTEQGSQPATSMDMSTQAVQFWLVLHMPLATQYTISNPQTILSGFRIRGR